MKLLRQKRPNSAASSSLVPQDTLFSPWFKAPRSSNASNWYPQGRAEWLLRNFYQRASRGSSQVKLLFSSLYLLHFSIKQISAQRPQTFSLSETFTERTLERSAKDLDPAFREPRSSWASEICWVPWLGSTLGLQLPLGIERTVPIGANPRRSGAETLKLTLLSPLEFWMCSSFPVTLSPQIPRFIATEGPL